MFRNILSIPAGLVAGGIVNMGLVLIGGIVIPPPAGADVTSMQSLAESMHLFGPEHFLFPFLAHSLGTLAGAIAAAAVATSYTRRFALVIGLFNLVGGSVAVSMAPAPMWFNVLDLVVAYLPMAYVGWMIVHKTRTAADATAT